jgi:hypothetical protein
MNKLMMSHVRIALLIAGLATLIPLSAACADSTNEILTPSLVSPPAQEDASLLNRRLLAVKKDLEQYQVFAENFATNGDMKAVEQLQGPLDDFLKRHVDHLLHQGAEQVNLETIRLSAEIMYMKTRLFANLNQGEAARTQVAEMKKRFGPYQKNTVHISGKSTTLSEAVRQLDEELAKTAGTKKR